MGHWKTKKSRKLVIGRHTNWLKIFNVNEYVKNPAMIEKLYEEKQLALVDVMELSERLEVDEAELKELRLEKQRLKICFEEASQRSSVAFCLSLFSLIMVGLGSNFVTSGPQAWVGWTLIVFGCLLALLTLFLRPRVKNE